MIDRLFHWAGAEGRFWFVLLGAAIVKVSLSEKLGWRGTLASFAVAFFSGWIGVDPVMHFFGLDETYRDLVVIALALTGESVMRAIILIVSDHDFLSKLLLRRLGGKK